MIFKDAERVLAVLLSFVLTTASSRIVYGYQAPESATGGGAEAAHMSAVNSRAWRRPSLDIPTHLSRRLAAATFPDQVAIANYWLQQNRDLSGKAFTEAVDKQTWDASVKALTQFPSVLDNMAKNLTWTSSLGEAYHNQATEVMEAIQTLRAKAKAAGNLKSGPQITVVQQTPQTIVIQPTNPTVVYVPEYDPALIYGTPYVVPGYTSGYAAAAGLLGFGAGVALGSWMGGGGWGWNSWNCDWHGGVVAYNHAAFYGNAAWHGELLSRCTDTTTNASIISACFANCVLPPDWLNNANPPGGPCLQLGQWAFRSFHPGGVNFAFADGSVKFVKNSVNVLTYRGLGTRNLGEVISSDQY